MQTISYNNIINSKLNSSKCILAPSQLTILEIKNKNTVLIRNLLSRELKKNDNGNEVGSINYITKSNYYFIRAKALQEEYYLPVINNETAVPIRMQVFKDLHLREGDLLISKDSNIGEAIILDKDYKNYTISGALYKLPIEKYKFYLFAFLKHQYFKKQLDLLVPKGSTIRHAKKLFLDCKIPFPNQDNAKEVIEYIEYLTQAIFNKEKEIREKNYLIFDLIQTELLENQRDSKFVYKEPKINDLLKEVRIDAGYYGYDLKYMQFIISNYLYGAKEIKEWGFRPKRGQNLQISQIGKSIYSDFKKEKFYTLIRPTNFSDFGTVEKFEYLGNKNELSTLQAGDIVFSGEGTVGKCVLFTDPKDKWITNIHGIVLSKKDYNIQESAFVSCFLRFLRNCGMLDCITVGGQGGSLAMKYWKDVVIATFPIPKQSSISSLYHNQLEYPKHLVLENFLQEDQKWNKKAGIIELDISIKNFKKKLNDILDKIVNDELINISL